MLRLFSGNTDGEPCLGSHEETVPSHDKASTDLGLILCQVSSVRATQNAAPCIPLSISTGEKISLPLALSPGYTDPQQWPEGWRHLLPILADIQEQREGFTKTAGPWLSDRMSCVLELAEQ